LRAGRRVPCREFPRAAIGPPSAPEGGERIAAVLRNRRPAGGPSAAAYIVGYIVWMGSEEMGSDGEGQDAGADPHYPRSFHLFFLAGREAACNVARGIGYGPVSLR
jgi:hypothetical protein